MQPVQRDATPVEDIRKINAELHAYNPEIAGRPQIIAANKIDAIYREEGQESPVERRRGNLSPRASLYSPISGVIGRGHTGASVRSVQKTG